ncbi:MAG: tetratricopeptide repeat protein [Planctomycetes bacterium]|nr:tetratricopeptide repeat protein [Planctomycetota bacterium]
MPDSKRLELLRKAVEKSPEADFPRYGLAMELASAGETEEAEKQFQELLEHHPAHVPGHFMLGKLYERLGRTEEARVILRRGIDAAQRQGNTHARQEMEEELEKLE